MCWQTVFRVPGPFRHLGMTDPSLSLQADFTSTPLTFCRPVCNRSKCSASAVSLPLPQPQRGRCGRTFPPLGVSRNAVCVSASTPAYSSIEQDMSFTSPSSVVGPGVAHSAMVQLPFGAVHLSCSQSPSRSVSVDTAGLDPPFPSDVQASHLDVVREGYRKRGYSTRVADYLAAPVQASTSNVYDSKWAAFHSWCSEQGIDPLITSTRVLADFLLPFLRSRVESA